MGETTVDVWIPDGYLAMPLADIDRTLAVVRNLAEDLPPSEAKDMTEALLPAVATLLGTLAANDTRYCGVGRHAAPTGGLVTSCVTVCVYETGKTPINPRLALKELVYSRRDLDENWVSEPIDIAGRPMMFSERIAELPAPELPGIPRADSAARTYQLEAVVPAEDGSAVAAVELSTAAVELGPAFRKMVFDMAMSVSFRPALPSAARAGYLNL
ncbi:hypothetical protein [Nocardia blacklockiae]|uniref:hypothetical protein n=1 Tax=Nocardia blacklockiae TaxID=480036 RepID=UPI00189481F4|nr:hypothetical protein [Nocardia blacklockiae]MBF6172615.1 hypothetical protein [Nocardia blacklockiae]